MFQYSEKINEKDFFKSIRLSNGCVKIITLILQVCARCHYSTPAINLMLGTSHWPLSCGSWTHGHGQMLCLGPDVLAQRPIGSALVKACYIPMMLKYGYVLLKFIRTLFVGKWKLVNQDNSNERHLASGWYGLVEKKRTKKMCRN